MNASKRLLPVLAALLGSAALSTSVLSTSAVGAELPAPADAKVVDQRPAVDKERIYPLGSLRKISGKLRMDGQVNAKGQVSATTYELPETQTARQAFNDAREALQQGGAHTLYWCQARDCGESSLWVNDVFDGARLSGADEQQAFVLLRQAAPDDNTLTAIYAITRGNRRAYLHVENFVADAPLGELLPTPATVLHELRSTGDLDYPAMGETPDDTWVALLARSLQLDSSIRVSVSAVSSAAAAAWRDALVAKGVRAARLETGNESVKGLHLEIIR